MSDAHAPLDLGRLLRTLDAHGVELVVVGGLAAIAHGARRMTLDLDVVPSPEPANFRRLVDAVAELGVAGDSIVNRAKDAPPYEDLAARAVRLPIAGVDVLVAGLDDLIAMKLASARPKDLQDVADVTAHEVGEYPPRGMKPR